MCTSYDVLSHFMLFCCEVVIYAVLSRYLSCGEILHMTDCHVEKILHMTKFSPRAPPVVPVTNIRYVDGYGSLCKHLF